MDFPQQVSRLEPQSRVVRSGTPLRTEAHEHARDKAQKYCAFRIRGRM